MRYVIVSIAIIVCLLALSATASAQWVKGYSGGSKASKAF